MQSLMRDGQAFSIWSITHALFGAFFFIILYKYFKLPPVLTVVLLLVLHTVYEWKDYYVSYEIYDNNPDKINAAHDFIYTNSPLFRGWSQLGLGPGFHLPPNSTINSIGDTFSYMIGVAIAYLFRRSISPTTLRIASWVSIIYWLVVLAMYIYVLRLGLHDKVTVDRLYRKSLS